MKTLVLMLSVVLAGASIASAVDQNVLTWTDNSNNETAFDIQRGTAANVAACQSGVTFTALVSVGANVTSYTDTAVVQGTTYCYRIDASNSSGPSAFSNIAGRTVPFTVPASPSGLTVN